MNRLHGTAWAWALFAVVFGLAGSETISLLMAAASLAAIIAAEAVNLIRESR